MIIISACILFAFGVASRKGTQPKNKLRGGFEILIIGLVSAFAGFAIGLLLKV